MSSSSTEIVGKKSAWQLWAETVKLQNEEGARLLKKGWFTTADFENLTGWTRTKCRKELVRQGLTYVVAYDDRVACRVSFFQPPAVPPRKPTSRTRA